MGKKAEIPLEKRAEINVLMSEGMSQKEIATRLSISQSAVSKILKRIINEGMFTPRPRSGRPKKRIGFMDFLDSNIEYDEENTQDVLFVKEEMEERMRQVELAKKIVRDVSRKTNWETQQQHSRRPNKKFKRKNLGKSFGATSSGMVNRVYIKKEKEEIPVTLNHSSLPNLLQDLESEDLRLQLSPGQVDYEDSMDVDSDGLENNFIVKIEPEDDNNYTQGEGDNVGYQVKDIEYLNGENYRYNTVPKREKYFINKESNLYEKKAGVNIKLENRKKKSSKRMHQSSQKHNGGISSVNEIDYVTENVAEKEKAISRVEKVEFLDGESSEDCIAEPVQATQFRIKKEKNPVILPSLEMDQLEEILQMSKALSHRIYQIDPVFERSISFKRALEAAMGPYKEMYKNLKG